MSDHGVVQACDLLLEEVEREISRLNRVGGTALMGGRLEEAERCLAQSRALNKVRDDVRSLRTHLLELLSPAEPAKRVGDWPEQHSAEIKVSYGAPVESVESNAVLTDGVRHSKTDYRVPLLRALVDLGGSAPSRKVIDHVGEAMKGQLSAWDRGKRPQGVVRWKNDVAWCRNDLKNEGLLSANSPVGIWEITEAGRRWLEAREQEARQRQG